MSPISSRKSVPLWAVSNFPARASTPVATVSLAIATRQDAASIGGLDALQGRAVLVAADRAALHLVRDAAPDLAVVAVSTPSEALRQVAAGQADWRSMSVRSSSSFGRKTSG